MASLIETITGYGLLFPITIDRFGKPTMGSGFALIESDLRILLSWPKLTRWFKSKYGSDIDLLLEEPNDDITLAVIKEFTVESISEWEPRVNLKEVRIRREDSRVHLQLVYSIRNTQLSNTAKFII